MMVLAGFGWSDRAPAAEAMTEIAGVKIPNAARLGGRELKLNGAMLKEATVFGIDVYTAALYLPDPASDAAAVIGSDSPKLIRLNFLRSISREDLIDSWVNDLNDTCGDSCDGLKERVRELGERIGAVREGQVFSYEFSGDKVVFRIDSHMVGQIRGASDVRNILSAFVGEKAPEELREGLMRS